MISCQKVEGCEERGGNPFLIIEKRAKISLPLLTALFFFFFARLFPLLLRRSGRERERHGFTQRVTGFSYHLIHEKKRRKRIKNSLFTLSPPFTDFLLRPALDLHLSLFSQAFCDSHASELEQVVNCCLFFFFLQKPREKLRLKSSCDL